MIAQRSSDVTRRIIASIYRSVFLLLRQRRDAAFVRSGGGNRLWAWLLVLVLVTGCGKEKETLFEEEHDLPPHWPSSLADAAERIEQRLDRLVKGSGVSESQAVQQEVDRKEMEQCESELRDLVEWIPEVAADTDLTESQWLPIYEMCEVMREHLSRSDVSARDISEDFRRLQTLLIESEQLLPRSSEAPAAGETDNAAQGSLKLNSVAVPTDEMITGEMSWT